jgi:hypothetical protein
MAGFWGKCRTAFRWCRLTVWLIVLAGLLGGIWLNRVGLPDFLKARLVAALSERGVQLQFSRMRLSLVRGLVAENVQIGSGSQNQALRFAAKEIQLELDYHALLNGSWQVNGLNVRNGTFTLAASPTNSLSLTNVQSAWRFEAGDTWAVDHFQAGFAGCLVTLSGQIQHAPEIRNWKFFGVQQQTTNHGDLTRLLQQISAIRERFYLSGQPWLNFFVDGDARDIHSVSVRLEVRFPGVHSPWFSARNLKLAARLSAPADAPADYDPSWGFWTNFQIFGLEWTARAADLRVQNLSLDTFVIGGDWHAPKLTIKKFSAQLASGQLDVGAVLDVADRHLNFTNDSSFDPHLLAQWLTEKARGQLEDIMWTQPPRLWINATLTLPPWTNYPADWREAVAPTVRLNGELAFTNAVAGGRTVDYLQTQFSYENQYWKLAALDLAQGRTRLQFDGDADETTHDFSGHLRGALDAASVRPFLVENNLAVQLNQVSFYEPLALDVAVQANWQDWQTLAVAGNVAVTNLSLTTTVSNQLDLDFLRTGFSYTNRSWQLSGLEAAAGRTYLDADAETSETTRKFTANLRGTFDMASLKPFLTNSKAIEGLNIVHFEEPLAFNFRAAGNWRDLSTLMATGSMALTNFSIRGQPADRVAGNFFYTNQNLMFFHPQMFRVRGTQMMKADTVTMDFRHGRLYFTNGFSTVDPLYVVRCIGPKTTEIVEPYHFPEPPTARVDGSSPMRDVKEMDDLDDANLTFVILKPTPFQWRDLRSTGLTGTIHWHGQQLVLTDIKGEIYGGRGYGNAHFYFKPGSPDADFNFAIAVTNLNLHLLAVDLSSPTNPLEGWVTGELTVTNGNTSTWRSWNGYGDARLSKGLLWNIPIFGLASGALNLFSPGLGNSRATDATMKFGLTNGVIYSDLLEMHTPTMRLEYTGKVDLAQNVNARVTAKLLRNAPVVGSMVSTVLWPVSKIFECQVTGQLAHPKVTPLWLPGPISNMLMLPLHPIRSIEGIFNPP